MIELIFQLHHFLDVRVDGVGLAKSKHISSLAIALIQGLASTIYKVSARDSCQLIVDYVQAFSTKIYAPKTKKALP